MSFSQKQNVLWNMIDPGDPYDIKKSLIAKLPGDKKMYMGDHLELIVLFQGAEIERLIENLNEYQIKYKEVKKIQLDKHSFEIQIKQLTQLCQSIDPLRNQNIRLKDFVSRQSGEIEMLKRQLQGVDQDLNMKYNQALEKIDDLFNQKNSLRGELNANKSKMIAFQRSKNRQIEDLRDELNLKNISQENQIKDLKRKFNSDVVQLQGDIRRYKDKLQNQRATIDQMRFTEQRITQQLQQYRIKISSSNSDNVIRDLQRKAQIMNSQKERLQGLLNQKTRQNGQFRSQIESKQMSFQRLNQTVRSLQNKVSRQDEQIRRLKRTDPSIIGDSPYRNNNNSNNKQQIFELRKKLQEYQEQIALISTETQRLNSLIEMKNQKIRDWERKYNILNDDYQMIRSQLDQGSYNSSPTKSDIPTDTKRYDEVSVHDLQRKNSILTRQNQNLKQREQVIREQLEDQIYRLKEEINQLRLNTSNVPWPKPGGETIRPNDLRPLNPGEGQGQRPSVSGHQSEIQSLNSQVYELKRVIQERERQIIQYKQRITQLRQIKYPPGGLPNIPIDPSGNQTIDNTVTPNKNQDIRRKLGQLQNKNISLNREVQRINNSLLIKQDENNRLNIEINRLKKALLDIPQPQPLPSSMNTSKVDERLRQQNQQLRSKLVPFVNEVNRLNQVLKEKVQEFIMFRNQNITLKNELSNYERQIVTSRRVIEDFNRKVVQLQRSIETDPRIQRLTNDNSRLEQELAYKTSELQTALSRMGTSSNQNQFQTSNLKQQISRLTQIIRRKEQDQNRLQGQYRQLQVNFNTIRNDAGTTNQRLNQQFQSRYNQIKEQLNQEIVKFTNSERSFTTQLSQRDQQIITLRRIVTQREQVINRNDANFNLKIQTFQNNLRNQINQANRKIALLSQQNQLYKNKDGAIHHQLNERANTINILTQQLQRANGVLNQHIEQINNYQRTYQQLVPYKEQLQAKIRQQHSLIQNSQQKIPQLAGQIQRLNANLTQKVQECEQLKRNINQFNNKYMQIISQHQRVVNTANQHNQRRQQEIEQGIRQYQQVIIQLKRQLEDTQRNTQNFTQQVRQFESRIHTVTSERDQLHIVLNTKNAEFQNIINQLNQAKGLIQTRATEVERQRIQFQRQINHLSSELQRLTQTYTRKSQEERRGFLTEIERLNNSLRLKVQESQEWHNQNNLLNRKLQQVSIAYNQLLPEYQASKGRMSQFQLKFNRLAEQFQRLSIIISRQKQQNTHLKTELQRFGNLQQMNKRLSGEIDRLNQVKQQLEQDIGQLRIRYSDQAALQKRLNEQLSLFVVLFAEIESLRKRVKDKQREVQEVRRSSLAPFRV